MGFDDGQIVLNSDNGIYYPGQMLCGRLEFSLDKNKTFRGIYADIKGSCKVHWTSRHSRRVNDQTEHYTVTHESYEEYLNMTIYLIGSKSGEQTLHPGRHVFPFECQIPPNCPSSFDANDGTVKYKIKITVDRAFKLDQTKTVDFRVIAPVDLNNNPRCKEPIVFEFEQTFCCWCMNSGLAETLIKLPVAGFCPKQIMPIEVSCKNNSSVELDKITFKLTKTVTFIAEREPDTRSYEETVAVLKKGPIPGNTTRNWALEMEVPDMDVYNLDTCRFINVEFMFRVDIETSGCHVDEDECHPIYIGSIPLGSLLYPPNSSENAQNMQGVTSYPAPPVINQPAPNYNNGPPYPGANPPYPGNTPNIGFNAPQNTPYPVSPYPVSPYPVSPYPVSPNLSPNPPYNTQQVNSNAPYPTSNSGRSSPYPGGNQPYPGTPNMGGRPPYPGEGPPNLPYSANPPYPTSPNVGANSNPPQSSNSNPTNAPYASSMPYSPGKPSVTSTFGLKTGNFGFTSETMPMLPPGGLPRPVSPFASASAPAATPDDDDKKFGENVPPYPPQ